MTEIQKTLNSDGWNRNGELHGSTFVRVILKVYLVQDEILELSLGNRPPPDILKARIE